MMTGPLWPMSWGRVPEAQRMIGKRPVEQGLSILFDEGQPTLLQNVENALVLVVDDHSEAAVGEAKCERNSDMTGAADDCQLASYRPITGG
jgi:hypothetical protein